MIDEMRSSEGQNRIALIIGVNGQDGSYLAQHLKRNAWIVLGIGRQSSARQEISGCLNNYFQVDIADTKAFQERLKELRPDVIFHTAATHGHAGFKYEDVWLDAHKVNTISLQAILEYVRLEKTDAQVVYFSSGKVFGDLYGNKFTEESNKVSRCIYSITKNAATSIAEYYRGIHGINVSVIWLFNHESERRTQEYFISRILSALKNSLENKKYKTQLRSLDFWCDWGSASEYMKLVANSCDSLRGDDFILATGKTVWAADVVRELFLRYGLTVEDHISTEFDAAKKQSDFWSASNEKFKIATGLSPGISGIQVFEDVFSKM